MASRPVVMLGNRRVELWEIGRVAFNDAPVDVDKAVMAKIVARARTPGAGDEGDLGDAPAAWTRAVAIPAEVVALTRATMLAVAVGIAHEATRVRPDVLQLLVQLLNSGITPVSQAALDALGAGDSAAFHTETLRAIALATKGTGFALVRGSDEATAVRAACVAAGVAFVNPRLSRTETDIVTQPALAARAEAALGAFAATRLVRSATVAASMTFECLDIPSQCFGRELADNRPHKGLATVSLLLGSMLQSSSKPKPAKGARIEMSTNVSSTPEVHGKASDVFDACARLARIEFSAAAEKAAPSRTTLCMNIRDVELYLTELGSLALARTAELAAKTGAGAPATAPISAARSPMLLFRTAAVEGLVMSELGLGSAHLRAKQAAKAAAADAKEAAKAAADAAKRPAKVAPEPTKPLTDKQKKAAAKKAEKARKAAEKAEKKRLAARKLHIGEGNSKIMEALTSTPSAFPHGISPFFPDSGTAEGFYATLDDVLLEVTMADHSRAPKIAKGTRDFGPEQMQIRDKCFRTIRSVFERHGAVEIDTPVFELRSTLMGKYGEEGGKLVYDLADQGGELLCMRYDLTVPFARYLAMNSCGNIKRFHIAKVYRRDTPAIQRGRYREFYQCDYDVAGSYACMMPETEVLKVGCEILGSLNIGGFMIKLNHRVLLDATLANAGVPAAKFRTICSSIDKLDKEPWADVKAEMVHEKGLAEAVADKIGVFVQMADRPRALLASLRDSELATDERAVQAFNELELLFNYLDAVGCLDHISFDLSLARGLDYYTGVIYEAVLTSPNMVGSVAAGGRYDNLVGMFSSSGTQVPCVGISIGIERIFAIMEAKARAAQKLQVEPVQVMVASVGSGMVLDRLRLCSRLWDAGISAQTEYAENPNWKKQIHAADNAGNPFMVIIGGQEAADGTVGIKVMKGAQQGTQVTVPRADMVAKLLEFGCAVQEAAAPLSSEDTEGGAGGAGAGAGAGAGTSASPAGDA